MFMNRFIVKNYSTVEIYINKSENLFSKNISANL